MDGDKKSLKAGQTDVSVSDHCAIGVVFAPPASGKVEVEAGPAKLKLQLKSQCEEALRRTAELVQAGLASRRQAQGGSLKRAAVAVRTTILLP